MVAVCVTEPEAPSVPLQGVPFAPPPLAVQLVAVVDDHVSVKELPTVTDWELVARVAVISSTSTVACVDTEACVGSMLWQVRPKVTSPMPALSVTVPAGFVDSPHGLFGMPPV